MLSKLVIEYCNPQDQEDTYKLYFDLEKNNFVPRWIESVLDAQKMYHIDDPERFYGFYDQKTEEFNALCRINECISEINKEVYIIEKKLLEINDQDTLNYLHSIFEKYHGLLDCQDTDFWRNASDKLKKNLANLNILVHRCENLRYPTKRHVVTYFGLPKTRFLSDSDYDLFTDEFPAGSVYLNYVEIGKTIKDLAFDNDHYISSEAFKPYEHFSADFVVNFSEIPKEELSRRRKIIMNYYESHRDFFGPWQKKYNIGSIILARAKDFDINEIKNRQFVKNVYFI